MQQVQVAIYISGVIGSVAEPLDRRRPGRWGARSIAPLARFLYKQCDQQTFDTRLSR
jgi:hypothetical protein